MSAPNNHPKLKPGVIVKFKNRSLRIMGVCHFVPTGDLCYAMMDESRNVIYVDAVETVETQYRQQ